MEEEQFEQLTVIRDLAERRAQAAEVALATLKAEAAQATLQREQADAVVHDFDAARPAREAAMRQELETSTDLRANDIFAYQAGLLTLSRERDGLLATALGLAQTEREKQQAVLPAAEAAQRARARAEKLGEAMKEILAEMVVGEDAEP